MRFEGVDLRRMSSLHMNLCLQEGVIDTPLVHDERSKMIRCLNNKSVESVCSGGLSATIQTAD